MPRPRTTGVMRTSLSVPVDVYQICGGWSVARGAAAEAEAVNAGPNREIPAASRRCLGHCGPGNAAGPQAQRTACILNGDGPDLVEHDVPDIEAGAGHLCASSSVSSEQRG